MSFSISIIRKKCPYCIDILLSDSFSIFLLFIAFSTANTTAFQREEFTKLDELPNDLINPLFNATVQAVEEAIINAMVAAETMEGINGNKAYALPHKLVMDVLKKYNRVK